MTDEQLHQQAVNFSALHAIAYPDALRAVDLIARHGLDAERARNSFAEGELPDDAQIAAFAEVESIKRRVTMEEALRDCVMEVTHARGSKRFYGAVRGQFQYTDSDMHDAAMMMAAQGGASYGEALQHMTRVVEFGDAEKAIEAAFSEGAEVTDGMAHAAAMAHMSRTGTGYVQSLRHVLDTMPIPIGAQFLEAAAAGETQQGIELEIFRAGTHIDSGGNRHTFTVADVQRMAAAYNPSKREAPMVKGHPGDDAPSYGWISSLRATEDGRLFARGTQWDDGFLAEVKAGRFKKRSASFYPPTHPSNPAQGTWYLRHLGWLGAQQPALGGLADASFQAPTADHVIFTV